MAELFPNPKLQFTTSTGAPLVGGKLYTYAAGTTTNKTTWQDRPAGTPNTNPIILDARGECSCYGDGNYKFVLKDSADVTIWTQDNVPSDGFFTNAALVALQASLSASSGSNTIGFIQAGAGAVARTMQAKGREIVSVKDFGAVGDGTTNDAAAVQAAINYIAANSGVLIFNPGTYLLGSQVTFAVTQLTNTEIIGYGAEIKTSGAISGLKITGSATPQHQVIRGLKINHRGNSTATAGFELVGTAHVSLIECVVEAHGVGANYGAFWLRQTDPADSNTGCFWTNIERCSVRKRNGSDPGDISNAIILQGAANATNIIGCSLTPGGTGICVKIKTESGQVINPNGVLLLGNHFEGFATAIDVVQATGSYCSGLRVIGNRAEAGTTFVSLTGSTTQPAVPIFLSGNYNISNVTTYASNPNGQYLNTHDAWITPDTGLPAQVYNIRGHAVVHQDPAYDAYTAYVPNTDSGFALKRFDNVSLATWRYKIFSDGIGTLLTGGWSAYRPLRLAGVQGIAARDTAAMNLAGTGTFAAATTCTVTLPIAEPDANYLIFIQSQANITMWISARTSTTFTVSASASNSNSFGWLLIRHL